MYHNEPIVKVLKDSICEGSRLVTLEIKFWRPILPELTRHRALSYTFRSSRATPVAQYLSEVRNDPWGPKHWTINTKGMVAQEELTDYDAIAKAVAAHKQTASSMASIVEMLRSNVGNLSKEILNRYLEPFISTTGIVSGTEWDNFFKLRCAKDAQGEIRDLANAIRLAMLDSTPQELTEGQWHLPYIDNEDAPLEDLIKASAARCARVSLRAFDGTTSLQKDIELCNKLIANSHFSPMEMVAMATKNNGVSSNYSSNWLQYRKVIEHDIPISFKQITPSA